MELKSSIQSLQFDILTIKRKINSQIRLLPDNVNIKRLNNKPNIYIMNFSEIVKDKNHTLSAEYYDFKYQYRKIIKKLKEINPLDTYNCITKMIIDKSFKTYIGVNMHSQPCFETVKLHPQVIEYLKQLIN